ncbi:hypothetical protein ACFPMF_24600 [Larkinella bovis]|uniref:Uncharacterized protein n=1 Tax=Larkinella bovis TaxID=683041 RepID=A0ABW0IG96_9BACT
MNRTVAYLLGPELVWLLTLALAAFLASRNQPTTEAGNELLLTLGWLLPTVAVLLSFVPLFWAPGSPWWWLLRIGIVGSLAVFPLTSIICGAIDYHDSRNSGVGSAIILYIILGYLLLFGGALIAVFFFLTKWPFLPVLKWSLIILGGLASLLGLIFWIASFGKSTPS